MKNVKTKYAHFIGLCGVGMSAVAKLLQDSGWQISGSDEGFYPPASDYLKEYNLACTPHYAAANIPTNADLIVIGKHTKLVPESNEEVKAAFASGISIKHFPEVLQEITAGRENIVISGSFGKSTCAYLTAYTLREQDPGYFLGAFSPDFPCNARLGSGKNFILEGDEYPAANWDSRSKFLFFNPHHVLLTSCEHDHLNVFPTLESYLKPFTDLLDLIPEDGSLTACLDGENVAAVIKSAKCPITTYSSYPGKADYWPENVSHSGSLTEFDLICKGETVARLSTLMLGEHNLQNTVGVAAMLLSQGLVTSTQIARLLEGFKGVKRRLELKSTTAQIPFYEDFGSSRAKALAGIRAIREQYPHRRLIVVFEPHTFSFRNREAIYWYDDLFTLSDQVYVFEPPIHGATSHDQLTQAEIVERIAATGKPVIAVSSQEDIIAKLRENLQKDDVILAETSGNLDGAIPEIQTLVESLL